jgi:ABC-type bacteriocin/lantibiotic exporter with double-glycine peptidase domain
MNKKSSAPLARLWALLQPNRNDIKQIYAYAIFSGIISLSLPLGIQAIVNLIQGGQVSTSWIVLVVLVVLGVVVSGILQVYQMRISEKIQQEIFTRATFDFAYRLPRIKWQELVNKYAPELVNRFFDTLTIQKGLSKILIDFTAAVVQIVFGLILLSFYHSIFILFSLFLLLTLVIIIQFTARPGLSTSLKESKYKYKVAYWLEEVARVSQTFKMAGNSELPLQKADESVTEYLKSRQSHFKILVQQYGLLIFFKVLVISGLLGLGGFLVIEQSMNIGQFIAAEIIILMVISSTDKVIQSLETIYDVLTALEKIGQVTDLELEETEGINASPINFYSGDGFQLNNIAYQYHNAPEAIFSDFNLHIPPKAKLVISGDSGSGKSTLLKIISGTYSPTKGSILLNKIPLFNYEVESLRSHLGLMLKQDFIFEGTLMENITLGRPNISQEDIEWALHNMGLTNDIANLPNGLNSVLAPSQMYIGQNVVQKIKLARAIVSRPAVLILDEPLSHLNNSEREIVSNFLMNQKQNWTLIVVSDCPHILSQADDIITLQSKNR